MRQVVCTARPDVPMTRQRLLKALEQLTVWKRGGARAPHKPLLLLWALGRIRRGENRLASYEREAEEPLEKLLRDFGPRRRRLHPENPFWHLQTDDLWEVDAALAITPGRSPTRRDLVRHNVSGGLPEPLHRLLRRDTELVRSAADLLLFEHFPESMHDAIREQVGLPRASTAAVREGRSSPRRPRRDPDFRDAVLRAYERRCAVCDFDLRLADASFGLDAAHIMWHSHGGPDEVPNGLALCAFHHKAFDRGVIGLEPESGDYRVLVSNELSGQSQAFREVLDLRDRNLRPPQEEELQPHVEYVNWHRRQVFRGAPRSRRLARQSALAQRAGPEGAAGGETASENKDRA